MTIKSQAAEQAILSVHSVYKSLTERATLAMNMNGASAAERMMADANILLSAVQVMERELGRRIVTRPPPAGAVSVPAKPRAAIVAPVNDDSPTRTWCDQCDRNVGQKEADFCRSKFCGVRP